MRCTSAMVAGSGKVGPDASADSWPAGTSVTASVTLVARRAATASRPPFTAETCFLTAFILLIGDWMATCKIINTLHRLRRRCRRARNSLESNLARQQGAQAIQHGMRCFANGHYTELRERAQSDGRVVAAQQRTFPEQLTFHRRRNVDGR